MGLSPISLALAYADWALHLAASPGRQTLLAQRAWTLGLQVLGQAAQTDARPPSTPETDPRFADPGWRQWPFKVLKHSFQAQNDWWTDAAQVNGMAKHSAHVMAFFTRQWMDALSPSNWGPTNPEVLRAAEESQGQSWARGYQAFVQDWMEAQHGRQHADDRPLQALPFEVGKDVASPGQGGVSQPPD
jgi:polyhydroxyalkanoate synthase